MIFSATAGLYLLRLKRSSSNLPGAFGDLFLDFAAAKLDIRNGTGQNRAAFLQLLVAQRFSRFGHPNNLHEIVRCHGSPRFAAQNVIQARERAALVVESIVVKEWIADTPPGETIDNDIELVFGGTFGGRPVPGENALVEALHFVDHRQFYLQSGSRNGANDFAETRDNDRFVLMDHEEQRSPFERGQDEKNAQDRHQPALQKPHNGREGRRSWSHIDHVHGDVLGCSAGSSGNVWRMLFRLSSTMIFFCKPGKIACIASR